MRLDKHFIKTVLPVVKFYGDIPGEVRLTQDSTSVKAGDYYVVLSDKDISLHINRAIRHKAQGFLIAEEHKEHFDRMVSQCDLIIVDDVVDALKRLAKAWRANFSYPVIGITGSVGKSCTKKVLSNILHKSAIVHHVTFTGNTSKVHEIALDILQMQTFHKVALFEMGTVQRGTMAELADIVRPSYAIITNIGHSNMEGLGSVLDIAMEKRDIFKYFTQESIGIVNGDTPILGKIGYIHPVIKFGAKTINQIQARKVHTTDKRISFTLKLYQKKYPVILKDTHEGLVFNALAATAAAHLVGVSSECIVQGIQDPILIAGRFEHRLLIECKGTLINDCSNTNPESMKAALLAFQKLSTKGQKIAVLGDMNGLGSTSPFWHRQIGRFLRKVSSVHHLILVGDMVKWTRKTLPVRVTADHVATWEDAAKKLHEKLKEESVVLVKGSDSTLHQLVDYFSEQTA